MSISLIPDSLSKYLILSSCQIEREGKDVTIVAFSKMVGYSLKVRNSIPSICIFSGCYFCGFLNPELFKVIIFGVFSDPQFENS